MPVSARRLVANACLPVMLTITIVACAQEPSPTEVIKNGWWIKKYAALNERLDSDHGGTLSFDYASGHDGSATVAVQLVRADDGGLRVITSIPPETFGIRDGDRNIQLSLRDHDLDGLPDDAKFLGIDMRAASAPKARYTNDGFVVLQQDREYDLFYFHWSVAVAVATNQVLYGRASIAPPEEVD